MQHNNFSPSNTGIIVYWDFLFPLGMIVLIPALVGLFMLLLSLSLLFGDAINLNLKVYWPIILIVLDLGLIIGRGRRS